MKRTNWFLLSIFMTPIILIVIYSYIKGHLPFYYLHNPQASNLEQTIGVISAFYCVIIGVIFIVGIIYFLSRIYNILERLDKLDKEKHKQTINDNKHETKY